MVIQAHLGPSMGEVGALFRLKSPATSCHKWSYRRPDHRIRSDEAVTQITY
jgi:hypothetical protein